MINLFFHNLFRKNGSNDIIKMMIVMIDECDTYIFHNLTYDENNHNRYNDNKYYYYYPFNDFSATTTITTANYNHHHHNHDYQSQ